MALYVQLSHDAPMVAANCAMLGESHFVMAPTLPARSLHENGSEDHKSRDIPLGSGRLNLNEERDPTLTGSSEHMSGRAALLARDILSHLPPSSPASQRDKTTGPAATPVAKAIRAKRRSYWSATEQQFSSAAEGESDTGGNQGDLHPWLAGAGRPFEIQSRAPPVPLVGLRPAGLRSARRLTRTTRLLSEDGLLGSRHGPQPVQIRPSHLSSAATSVISNYKHQLVLLPRAQSSTTSFLVVVNDQLAGSSRAQAEGERPYVAFGQGHRRSAISVPGERDCSQSDLTGPHSDFTYTSALSYDYHRETRTPARRGRHGQRRVPAETAARGAQWRADRARPVQCLSSSRGSFTQR